MSMEPKNNTGCAGCSAISMPGDHSLCISSVRAAVGLAFEAMEGMAKEQGVVFNPENAKHKNALMETLKELMPEAPQTAQTICDALERFQKQTGHFYNPRSVQDMAHLQKDPVFFRREDAGKRLTGAKGFMRIFSV